MNTYYTTDFTSVEPTGHIAFCAAHDRREARRLLKAAIIMAGCGDPKPGFKIEQLPRGTAHIINGDY